MTDLFSERLKRMDDATLFQACIEYGKGLEEHMTVRGFLPIDFRIRAARVYHEATQRPGLVEHHQLFSVALSVVAIL